MVAGIGYDNARQVMFGAKKTGLLSEWPDIKRTLQHFGIKHAPRAKRSANWLSIRTVAIVGCGKKSDKHGQPEWHWVVFDPSSQSVFDPLKKGPVHFSKIRRKPFSYLGVL